MSEPATASRLRRVLVASAAIVVVASAAAAVVTTLSPRPAELLARAAALVAQGRAEEAASILDSLDSDDPVVLARRNELRAAIEKLREREKDEVREDLALARAKRAAAEGDYRAAAVALSAAGESTGGLRREVASELAKRVRVAIEEWDLDEGRKLLDLARRVVADAPETGALEVELSRKERDRERLEKLLGEARAARERGDWLAAEQALRRAGRIRASAADAAAIADLSEEVFREAKEVRDRQAVLDRVAALLDAGKVAAARKLLKDYANDTGDDTVATRVDALRDLEKQGGTDAFLPARRALRWLAAHQDPKTGGFDAKNFAKVCGKPECSGAGNASYSPGVSGLALMAFTAFRDLDLLGEFGEPAKRCGAWLAGQIGPDGRAGSNHYNTAIAALALLERVNAVGAETAEAEREAAARSVAYLCGKGQLADGGWRYSRANRESDVSVTCWVMQALHAAREAGIEVESPVVEEAFTYLDSMTSSGGFTGYVRTPSQRIPLTAASLLVRRLFRTPEQDPLITTSTTWLTTRLADVLRTSPRDPHRKKQLDAMRRRFNDEYGWYYLTYALHRGGGEPWDQWGPLMEQVVSSRQSDKGHAAGSTDPALQWEKRAGRVYSTAMSALMLEAYYRHKIGK